MLSDQRRDIFVGRHDLQQKVRSRKSSSSRRVRKPSLVVFAGASPSGPGRVARGFLPRDPSRRSSVRDEGVHRLPGLETLRFELAPTGSGDVHLRVAVGGADDDAPRLPRPRRRPGVPGRFRTPSTSRTRSTRSAPSPRAREPSRRSRSATSPRRPRPPRGSSTRAPTARRPPPRSIAPRSPRPRPRPSSCRPSRRSIRASWTTRSGRSSPAEEPERTRPRARSRARTSDLAAPRMMISRTNPPRASSTTRGGRRRTSGRTASAAAATEAAAAVAPRTTRRILSSAGRSRRGRSRPAAPGGRRRRRRRRSAPVVAEAAPASWLSECESGRYAGAPDGFPRSPWTTSEDERTRPRARRGVGGYRRDGRGAGSSLNDDEPSSTR